MSTLKQLWVAVGGAIAMFVYSAFIDDNSLSGLDWVKIANMAVGAVAVWWATNGPVGSGAWQFAKTGMAALSAALVAFLSIIQVNGEISPPTGGEWVQIGIAVLTALGVLVTPGMRLSRTATSVSGTAVATRVYSTAPG